jgi:hypothetical protein
LDSLPSLLFMGASSCHASHGIQTGADPNRQVSKKMASLPLGVRLQREGHSAQQPPRPATPPERTFTIIANSEVSRRD